MEKSDSVVSTKIIDKFMRELAITLYIHTHINAC